MLEFQDLQINEMFTFVDGLTGTTGAWVKIEERKARNKISTINSTAKVEQLNETAKFINELRRPKS